MSISFIALLFTPNGIGGKRWGK